MGKAIFSGFGMFITKEDGKYFINYDTGGIANKDVKYEISEEEVHKAQKSGEDAYDVMLLTQVRENNRR